MLSKVTGLIAELEKGPEGTIAQLRNRVTAFQSVAGKSQGLVLSCLDSCNSGLATIPPNPRTAQSPRHPAKSTPHDKRHVGPELKTKLLLALALEQGFRLYGGRGLSAREFAVGAKDRALL